VTVKAIKIGFKSKKQKVKSKNGYKLSISEKLYLLKIKKKDVSTSETSF